MKSSCLISKTREKLRLRTVQARFSCVTKECHPKSDPGFPNFGLFTRRKEKYSKFSNRVDLSILRVYEDLFDAPALHDI